MEPQFTEVTREVFINSDLNCFRYENSKKLQELRLFHCAPDGSHRFALYFPNYYKRLEGEPYTLDIHLSCVSNVPQKITIYAEQKEKSFVHYVPTENKPNDVSLAEKICQVLNFHQPCKAVIP